MTKLMRMARSDSEGASRVLQTCWVVARPRCMSSLFGHHQKVEDEEAEVHEEGEKGQKDSQVNLLVNSQRQ